MTICKNSHIEYDYLNMTIFSKIFSIWLFAIWLLFEKIENMTICNMTIILEKIENMTICNLSNIFHVHEIWLLKKEKSTGVVFYPQ